MKRVLSSVLLVGAMCIVPAAFASGTAQVPTIVGQSLEGLSQVTPSELHYLRVGITQFNKGHYDKAEYAFKAVLRADTDNVYAKQYLYVITELRKLQAK